MNYILTVFAVSLLIVGVIGAIVPGLPGPPFAWGGILLAFMCKWNHISWFTLIIVAVIAVAVTVFDWLCPSLITKSGGGSRAATTGCTVGIIAGMFIPFGILFCPFIGALIGEMVNTEGKWKTSLKAAWHAFAGFFLGTGIKLLFAGACIALYVLSWRS